MSDEKLKRIEDKIDKQQETISEISTTLAVNTEQLKIHVEGVRQTRELIKLNELEINERLKPIENHVNFINALAKIISVVISLFFAAKELHFF